MTEEKEETTGVMIEEAVETEEVVEETGEDKRFRFPVNGFRSLNKNVLLLVTDNR